MSNRVKIRGIGPRYAKLLQAADVDQVGELVAYERKPQNLLGQLAEVNVHKRVVRRLPTEGMVHRWIVEGRTLMATGKAKANSRLAGPVTTPPPRPVSLVTKPPRMGAKKKNRKKERPHFEGVIKE